MVAVSTAVVYTVWCDGEGCLQWDADGSENTITKAVASAKHGGWVRKRVNGRIVDLCPHCKPKCLHLH